MFSLSVIVLLATPEAGTRVFYVVFSIATGYWLWRALHVGVELTPDALIVRGQLWTRRLRLDHVERARLEESKATARAPLAKLWPPFLALTIDLTNGTERQFEDVSASSTTADVLEDLVVRINDRLGGV